ncbi:MAG TPA: CHAT domain-containing protein [Thermoanaerobaculia bacterium]|jgi:CHAT domain-containing protein|nr:CHAT domain-containing protein [Thermoanaerobaculia bacterium]
MLVSSRPSQAISSGSRLGRRGWLAVGLLIGFVAILNSSNLDAGAGKTAPAPDPFAACEERVRAEPDADGSYLCFYEAGAAAERFAEADARLARAGREPIGMAWAKLVRGHIAVLSNEERALALYRDAAKDFARLRLPQGEVRARANLRNILQRRGETAAAAEQAARAVALAEGANDPDLLTLALIVEANQLMESGGDLGHAGRNLRRAEALLFPKGPAPRQQSCLTALAGLSFRLGRYDEASGYYRRLVDIYRAEKSQSGQANATYNLALIRQRQLEELPEPGGIEEVDALAREALSLARATEYRDFEQRSLQLLGENERARGHRANAHKMLDESVRLARELEQPERVASALWSLADLTEGAEAAGFAHDAIETALAIGNPRSLAIAIKGRMRTDWRTLPRASAVANCFQALSVIESLRAFQPEEESRIGLFSAWTQNYRWLAGRLLDGDPDLPRAFEVMERMRGRFLLESLADGNPRPPVDPAARKREADALTALAAVQLRLLDPGLPGAGRAPLLAELERRELDLAEASVHDGKSSPRTDSTVTPLAGVQKALAPNEALLLFQLGSRENLYGDFAGGSWLIVLTRSGVRAHRLPDRAEIEALLPVFLGLLERRDGREAPAAARLGDLLLGPALAALPKSVNRLVIVPDGALYSLPWDALRTRREGEPLGLSYELALAPSATLFARWRARPAATPSRGALVLADPDRPYAGRAAATRGGEGFSSIAEAARFGPLPYARREGQEVAGRLPRSELLTGAEATERALARSDLAPFAALHFAAHAIADAAHPERSAVLLAPGGPGGPGAPSGAADGLLQPREIVLLPLSGKLAVLSACRTADGAVISGEGTMSLARAFFQAGATTVIGSQWPLADDEAEKLSESFYRALVQGEPAGRALAQARREAADSGLPPAAWAGLVLMGDPAFTLPLALQRPPRSIPGGAFGWGGILLGIGAAYAVKVALSRKRRASSRIG